VRDSCKIDSEPTGWRNKAIITTAGSAGGVPPSGETKPLRVFAALAAAKTGLDWRGEMGSSEEPQLWSFQVWRLGGGRHGVARDGLVSVKLVGVGGAWAIELMVIEHGFRAIGRIEVNEAAAVRGMASMRRCETIGGSATAVMVREGSLEACGYG
jgi:hypothetical protein